MADRKPSNAKKFAFGGRTGRHMGNGGGPGGTRYPNPSTAYGTAAFSPPHAASTPDFSGSAGQLLSAAGQLSPAPNTAAKAPRPADGRDAAPSKQARLGGAGESAAARRGLWAPSADIPTGVKARGARPTHSGDAHYHDRGASHARSSSQQRPAKQEARHPRGVYARGKPSGASPGGGGRRASPKAGSPRDYFSVGGAAEGGGYPGAGPPAASSTPLAWQSIEAVGKWQLGEPAVLRRTIAENEAEEHNVIRGCPVDTCPMYGVSDVGAGWMSRHLKSHTQTSAEKQQTETYITTSVFDLLHDMCLDVEVPPAQRKLERQRKSRALLKTPRAGIGLQAALVETKVTGNNDDPLVRRCAHDLAFGSCKGLNHPEAIVRCDKCYAWFHISCGQIGIGSGISTAHSWDETLCRNCSRIAVGGWGKDPGPAVEKQSSLMREKRQHMLAFLEAEVESSWPEGVFDLPISAEVGATRNARGHDGKRAPSTINAAEDGGPSSGSKKDRRPLCAAGRCERETRPDSRFCCDGCGVLNAESMLCEALRHSLEHRVGIERGRRLREIREMKFLKSEVGLAMKRLQQPRPPEITLQHESMLRALVERRRRLWKRLIEIGAYWEKVSGSRSLPQVAGTKQARAIQTGPASGGQVAAGQKVRHQGIQGGGGGGSSGSGSGESGANANTAGRSSTATAAGNGGGVTASSSARSSSQKAVAAAEDGRGNGGADVEMAEAAGRGGAQGTTESGQKAAQIGDNVGPQTPQTAAQANMGTADVHAAAAAFSSTSAVRRGAQANVVVDVGMGAGVSSRAGVSSDRLDGAENLQIARKGVALADERCAPAEGLGGAGIVGGVPGCANQAGGAAASASRATEQVHEARPAKRLKGLSPWPERNATEWALPMREQAKVQPPPQQDNATGKMPPAAGKGNAPASGTPQGASAKVSPPVQRKGKAAAAAAAAGSIPREGLKHMMCIYCGKETGQEVTEHLEECYRRVAALRNERLDSATLRPLPERPNVLEGGSYLSVAAAAGAGGGAPPLATTTLDFSNTIGRQLLGRRICFADFDALPDPTQFQLHNDLKGWMGSSSRLDFLYKELVRQRNAAIHELQALERDEASLDVLLRRDWMDVELKTERLATMEAMASSRDTCDF